MKQLVIVVLASLSIGVFSVRAENRPYICSQVADQLTTTPDVMALAEKVYGSPLQYRSWSESAPCVVPTVALDYKTQTVLISSAEPPYNGHACQATLSAHVFRKSGAELKLERSIKDFVKTGESCVAGRFRELTIAGRDAFSIEGVGGGQGVSAGWLEFYQFDGQGIRQMKLPGLSCIWIDYHKAGAAAAGMESIAATWRIGGPNHSQLFLDFQAGTGKSKASVLKTQWVFGRTGLKLVRGRIPEAFADGACL